MEIKVVARDSLGPNKSSLASVLGHQPSPSPSSHLDMASAPPSVQGEGTSEHEKFVHHIAVKLSRFLNTLNPSDGLATTVINFGKTHANDVSKFKSCMLLLVHVSK
jgi:hypothetical protein